MSTNDSSDDSLKESKKRSIRIDFEGLEQNSNWIIMRLTYMNILLHNAHGSLSPCEFMNELSCLNETQTIPEKSWVKENRCVGN